MRTNFWENVEVSGEDDCWIWRGRVWGKYGYWKSEVRPHREAYFSHYGKPEGTVFVKHVCSEPLCCNPKHLVAIPSSGKTPGGERHPLAILRDNDVANMRKLAAEGMARKELARRFGVSISHVARIVTGQRRPA